MAHDISIEEEDFRIAENRHDEIIKSLGKVVTAMSNQNDKALVDAINKQAEKFDDVAKAIQEKPPVNIDLNTKDFVSSILLIRDEIIESNKKTVIALEDTKKSTDSLKEAIETRLLPDTFDLVRSYGITQSVKVNYKQANQIIIKK
jgi:prephenate dehydrogenase